MIGFVVFVSSLAIAGVSGQAPYGYQPYADDASVYSYDWRVQDHLTGQDFGQGEVRQGYSTDGEYQVVLPDGRKQIVTYKVADQHSGYIADVRYEGEPTYVAPAPYNPPAPYVAPYVAPTPAPYVAPAPTAAPYVAPVITPAPYVAPVQPFTYAQAYKPYAPVQPYAPVPAVRKYNFVPVEPAVPVAAVAAAVPVAAAAVAEPVPAVPVEAAAEVREADEGVEVENPVPVVDNLVGDWDHQIYYSDAHHLKPQRKEKVHTDIY